MRKKVLSIILGMAMLSGVLAGCGSKGGGGLKKKWR